MLFNYLVVISITISVYAIHKWLTKYGNYFEKKGVKSIKLTRWSYNASLVTFHKYSSADYLRMVCRLFSNEKLFGIFDFRKPVFIVRDAELVKLFCVKYFNNFSQQAKTVDLENDILFYNALPGMKGEKWRQMRVSFSPVFTGSKMRQMFELIANSLEDIIIGFKTKLITDRKFDWEMIELFALLCNDVTATSTIGVKVNSMENPDNEYYGFTKAFNKIRSFKTAIKMLFLMHFRPLARLLKLQMISTELGNRFKSMILDSMDYRMKNNISRPDAVNMLMQLRSVESTMSQLKEQEIDKSVDGFATTEEADIDKKSVVHRQWTDDEIVAQGFIFFAGGINVPSLILSFTAYELAMNPDTQDKLYAEIRETIEQLGTKRIDYDTLQRMKYLDQVATESLRKWPTTTYISRECVKDVKIVHDSMNLDMERGSVIWCPMSAIHHDPDYFPNPEKFDPERFSDENKHQIVPGSYLPFGMGPRNCIGSRYVMMEVKAILVFLLQHFSVEPNEKTETSLKLKKAMNASIPVNGVHLKLKPRNV